MLIDIHSHVLDGVDDGPETPEIAMDMLRAACDDGIRAVVATPHILDGLLNEELILTHFKKITEAVIDEKLPIDVFLGSEIHFQFGLEEIVDSSVGTYRGMGEYFLIETPMNYYPEQFEESLYKLINRGKTPIFAHPERIGPIVGNHALFADLVFNGVLLQVNSGSLLGKFGETIHRFAWDLIEKRLAHFIASDAHGVEKRSFTLSEAYGQVLQKYGEDMAEMLCYENPLKVLFGEKITVQNSER